MKTFGGRFSSGVYYIILLDNCTVLLNFCIVVKIYIPGKSIGDPQKLKKSREALYCQVCAIKTRKKCEPRSEK